MAAPFSEFVGNKRLLWIAQEWDKYADELAEWAMEHLVNRRDVWGQYTVREGEVGFVTLPIPERRGPVRTWSQCKSCGAISQAGQRRI